MSDFPTKEVLLKNLFFNSLTERQQKAFVNAVDHVSYGLGDVIIREGDLVDKMFILCKGSVRVVKMGPDAKEITQRVLESGHSFGEAGIILGQRSAVSLRASSPVQVIEISKSRFSEIVPKGSGTWKLLEAIALSPPLRHFLEEFAHFFASVEEGNKDLFAWVSKIDILLESEKGEEIFKPGEEPNKLYWVLSGEVELIGRDGNKRRVKAGDVIGENAFFNEKNHEETAKVVERARFAALNIGDFKKVLKSHPALKEELLCAILYDRHRHHGKALEDLDYGGFKESSGKKVKSEKASERRYKARGRLVFPFIEQHDMSDCGAACLGMICKYYGKRLSMMQIRDMVDVSQQGSSLLDIAQGAEMLGCKSRPVKATYEGLLRVKLPMIVHWGGNHYVVLYKIGKNQVKLADPAHGKVTLSKEEFLEQWTGFGIIIEPTREFSEVEEKRPTFKRFVQAVLPYKGILFEVFLAALLISLLGLATPFFTQTLIDNVIVNRDLELLNVLLFGMLAITLFSGLASFLRSYLLTHVGNKIEVDLLGQFLKHVLSVPMKFFNMRKVGDVLARFGESRKIQDLLTGRVIAILLDVLMAVIYLAIMFAYSVRLSLIVVIFIPLFLVLTLVITPIFKNLRRKLFEAGAATEGYLIETVTGIATVKTCTAELPSRWKWERLFCKLLKTNFSVVLLGSTVEIIGSVANTLLVVVMLWYGARQVIDGMLSIGQLIAFQTLAGSFIRPILALIGQWTTIQEALVSVEKLNDIYEVKVEEPAIENPVILNHLEGRVAFDDVSFSYTKNGPMVLKNISFEALPGQTIAIVGRSGSGKTTLINLLLRFYRPNEGRVLVDNHDLNNIALRPYRDQIGTVVQDSFLFSGSIRENIVLGQPDATTEDVVRASQMAAAHDFILKIPMGYNTKVGERGMSLSGGQRQRVCIARALVRNPRLLIFDEATSSLDSESEEKIQNNLAKIAQDRTTFIIAHRLSTVEKADQILVLDAGLLVERGTHEELMQSQGVYYNLNKRNLNL